MIGRGYLFGLGAAGEAGVDHALAHFDSGLRRTMALLGARRVSELTSDLVSSSPPGATGLGGTVGQAASSRASSGTPDR